MISSKYYSPPDKVNKHDIIQTQKMEDTNHNQDNDIDIDHDDNNNISDNDSNDEDTYTLGGDSYTSTRF